MPSDAKNIPIVRILVSAKRIHSSLLAQRINAHRWECYYACALCFGKDRRLYE